MPARTLPGPGAPVGPARAPILACITLLLALLGCAATARPPAPRGPIAEGLPRVALLPLENLSGRPESLELLTRIFGAALGRGGLCEPVEPGEVDAVMTELRVRSAEMLTREQAAAIARKLGARYLMVGTILEYGTVRTPDGDVPAVGVALRLLTGDSARVVWTGMKVRTGDDRETVFGWGRERSLQRLAERTADEILHELRLPEAAPTRRVAP